MAQQLTQLAFNCRRHLPLLICPQEENVDSGYYESFREADTGDLTRYAQCTYDVCDVDIYLTCA